MAADFVGVNHPRTDSELYDDKTAPDFNRSTLMLGETTVDPGVDFAGPGLTRDRPQSTMSRNSTASQGSKTSMNENRTTVKQVAEAFFSKKENNFEKAVNNIRENCIKADLDGDIKGAWLLTEIDHWDCDHERILILTTNSLLIARFDFVVNKYLDFRRIMLNMVQKTQIGDFNYPEKSMMPPRKHGGVRIHWGVTDNLSFAQKWNPWARDIPFITFAHHPILYNENEKETVTYNVDDFLQSFQLVASQAVKAKNPGRDIQNIEAPIMIESYASLSSMIFNQSFLGFSRDRNGISF